LSARLDSWPCSLLLSLYLLADCSMVAIVPSP
jgi:hypothetical protein